MGSLILTIWGKRARGSKEAEDEPKGGIPVLMGKPAVKDDDTEAVQIMIAKDSIGINAWVTLLSLAKLRELEVAVDRHIVANGGSDTAIRAYVEILPEYEKLQDI